MLFIYADKKHFVFPFGGQKIEGHEKREYEVFGFAPYWTINKLDNVDFGVLTTFAYFGVPVLGDGNLDTDDIGYEVFQGKKATQLFKKAHDNGTKVVLTITQMDNQDIEDLLEDDKAWDRAISQTIRAVKEREIDGVNVDFEYVGDPGEYYRKRFSSFIEKLTDKLHKEIPSSSVTVSVYASSVMLDKMYDIARLGKVSDGIFMMAYDFATTSSDNAIPTSPLYGYKEGKYWYDVSTAVDDFLSVISPDKLILGVPYYGYNYLVNEPKVKAETLPYWTWKGNPKAQTYSIIQEDIGPNMPNIDEYVTGWDNYGKVNWKAYYDNVNYAWRIVFLEDQKSLGLKYDFAKKKSLKGVGIWALGFDHGRTELWDLLGKKFGTKLADGRVAEL